MKSKIDSANQKVSTKKLHKVMTQKSAGAIRNLRQPYPENLLEDILRIRSLNRGLEALGYPRFLIKLYRKALRSRSVMN